MLLCNSGHCVVLIILHLNVYPWFYDFSVAVVVDVSYVWNRSRLDAEILKILHFHSDKRSVLVLNKVSSICIKIYNSSDMIVQFRLQSHIFYDHLILILCNFDILLKYENILLLVYFLHIIIIVVIASSSS